MLSVIADTGSKSDKIAACQVRKWGMQLSPLHKSQMQTAFTFSEFLQNTGHTQNNGAVCM
jgi:hypothetical protein